jgi:hypothetical protein
MNKQFEFNNTMIEAVLEDQFLMFASNNGHHETVKVLLEAGADVNAKDGEALRLAEGNAETSKVLKEAMQ